MSQFSNKNQLIEKNLWFIVTLIEYELIKRNKWNNKNNHQYFSKEAIYFSLYF